MTTSDGTIIQLLVLNDEETCTEIDGCFAVDFDNEEDAVEFADTGMSRFHLSRTTETVSVPLYKAVRK